MRSVNAHERAEDERAAPDVWTVLARNALRPTARATARRPTLLGFGMTPPLGAPRRGSGPFCRTAATLPDNRRACKWWSCRVEQEERTAHTYLEPQILIHAHAVDGLPDPLNHLDGDVETFDLEHDVEGVPGRARLADHQQIVVHRREDLRAEVLPLLDELLEARQDALPSLVVVGAVPRARHGAEENRSQRARAVGEDHLDAQKICSLIDSLPSSRSGPYGSRSIPGS